MSRKSILIWTKNYFITFGFIKSKPFSVLCFWKSTLDKRCQIRIDWWKWITERITLHYIIEHCIGYVFSCSTFKNVSQCTTEQMLVFKSKLTNNLTQKHWRVLLMFQNYHILHKTNFCAQALCQWTYSHKTIQQLIYFEFRFG
jgi:hypothetical protein